MDEYHPHYPSIDKDYHQRLYRFAGYLLVAKEKGIRLLAFNKESKAAVGWVDMADDQYIKC